MTYANCGIPRATQHSLESCELRPNAMWWTAFARRKFGSPYRLDTDIRESLIAARPMHEPPSIGKAVQMLVLQVKAEACSSGCVPLRVERYNWCKKIMAADIPMLHFSTECCKAAEGYSTKWARLPRLFDANGTPPTSCTSSTSLLDVAPKVFSKLSGEQWWRPDFSQDELVFVIF